MKKSILFLAIAVIALSSCSTITHTATTYNVDTEIYNRTTADLKISDQKITYTFNPTDMYRRAGDGAVKRAAVAKALEQAGNADVLVAPQFEIKKKRGLFTSKILQVIVTGHPATYVNAHSTTKVEAEIVNILDGGVVIASPCK